MYRYISSIRHARGSSLFPLFTSKHSLPSSASSRALASRYDNEHVRGFSTGNWDSNPFSMLGRENLNSRSKNDGNETLGKNHNMDSFAFAARDRENVNSIGDKVPDILKKYLPHDSSPSDTQDRDSVNSSGAESGRSINGGLDAPSSFMRGIENINSRSENGAGNVRSINHRSDGPPFLMRGGENMSSRSENDVAEKSYRPMDFVRGAIEEDGKDIMGHSSFFAPQLEMDADFVHIKLLRNNTFVTVTDSKGNTKLSGSAGALKEMKAGQKLSRYAAEATAEVVGRRARSLGLKAVVMKVNGFTYFRRKRQAIMSWLEGFSVSRGDKYRNPVVYIEDTTRKPHNGCRLPKKRRI